MPAHVAEHQHTRACLLRHLLKMRKINRQILGRLNEHGPRPDRGNGPRHRCQRKGIGQDRRTGRHLHRAQSRGHCIAPRGNRKAIARAKKGREFLFQQRGLRDLTSGGIIAMQTAVAHDLDCGGNPLFGDRFLLCEISVKAFHGDKMSVPAIAVNAWRGANAVAPCP